MAVYKLLRVPARPRDPMLPCVSRAVILSMSTDSRLTTKTLSDLCCFCFETWIQVNPGWKGGLKPGYVQSTAQDLIHAYRNACSATADVDGPVLFFEEDAIVLNWDRDHYERVDTFLKQGDYDWYSFGSLGEFSGDDKGHHRRFRGTVGCTQAVVWSKGARNMLLQRAEGCDLHIDSHFLSLFQRKFSYRIPLIVQLFPTTQNMTSWCVDCDEKKKVKDRLIMRVFQAFLQNVLSLDRRPDSWTTLYAINDSLRHAKYGIGVCVYIVSIVLMYMVIRDRGSNVVQK